MVSNALAVRMRLGDHPLFFGAARGFAPAGAGSPWAGGAPGMSTPPLALGELLSIRPRGVSSSPAVFRLRQPVRASAARTTGARPTPAAAGRAPERVSARARAPPAFPRTFPRPRGWAGPHWSTAAGCTEPMEYH